MHFTIREISSSNEDNYVIRDMGIEYQFIQKTQTLKILPQGQNKDLLHIECKEFLQGHISNYIEHLTKAIQIQALQLSGEQTNRIIDVIAWEKLPSLLHHATETARDCYMLHNGQLNKFSEFLRQDYDLKCAYIKYIQSSPFVTGNKYAGHFTARIKTFSNEKTTLRSCTLPRLLCHMADAIIMDIVSKYYAHNQREEAELLMKLSTRLNMIGRTLDKEEAAESQIISASNNTQRRA